MGCCQPVRAPPPFELSPIEKIAFQHESVLTLHSKNLDDLIVVFDKSSKDGYLAQSALKQALENLSIDTSTLSSSSLIGRFYKSIEEQGKIPLNYLKYLSILVSIHSNVEKINVLAKMSGKDMDSIELRRHLDGLSTVAIQLVWLSEGNTDQHNKTQDIQSYVAELEFKQSSFVHDTNIQILGSRQELKHNELTTELDSTPERKMLLYASGLRTLIHRYQMPPAPIQPPIPVIPQKKKSSSSSSSDKAPVENVAQPDNTHTVAPVAQDIAQPVVDVADDSSSGSSIETTVVCLDEGLKLKKKKKLSKFLAKQGKSKELVCRVCNFNWEGDGYYCKSCEYTLCEDCYEFYDEEPLEGALCSNGHPLREADSSKFYNRRGGPKSYKCNKCTNSREGKSYHCRVCQYDLCKSCKRSLGGLVCEDGHPLVLRTNFEKKVKCKFCEEKKKTHVGYTCYQCEFDACLECASTTERRNALVDGAGHLLQWTLESERPYPSFICNVHGGDGIPGPNLHCPECQWDVCPTCAGLPEPTDLPVDSSSEGSSNESKVVCANDLQQLRYKKKLYKVLVRRGQDRNAVCGVCEYMWEGKGFYCANCDYILCDACHEFYEEDESGLTCQQGHQLRFYNASKLYHKRYDQPEHFNCNNCREIKEDKSYHCRVCQYDVCKNCFKVLTRGLTCKEGHQLGFYTNYSKKLKCKLCKDKKKTKAGFCCEDCNYNVCPECAVRAGKKILQCGDGEEVLKWTDDRGYASDAFICNSCRERFEEPSMHCAEHQWDICATCVASN